MPPHVVAPITGQLPVDLNSHVKLLTGAPPQTSDIRTTPWPSGGTSRMSRSRGMEGVTPIGRPGTSTTGPRTPWTWIVEGYGDACPWSGMVIWVSFENEYAEAAAGASRIATRDA